MEPRVNGAKMQKFIGRTVRLPCRVLKVRDTQKTKTGPSQLSCVVNLSFWILETRQTIETDTHLPPFPQFQGQDAVVEAADGSQIQVVVSIVRCYLQLPNRERTNEPFPQDSNMNSQYVEIVGQVKDESSIRMLSVLNIGDSMGEALKSMFVDRSLIVPSSQT
jgi:hypothetical protein